MEFILVTGMVIGAVELVKRAFDRDYRGVVTIVAAVGVGGLCGYFGVEGIDVATGLYIGLAGAGAVTVVDRV